MGRVMMLLYIREQVDEKSSREREELGGGGLHVVYVPVGNGKETQRGRERKMKIKK